MLVVNCKILSITNSCQLSINAIVYQKEIKSDFVLEDLYPCIQHHVNTEALCVIGHEDNFNLIYNDYPFERMFHRPSYISVLENPDIKYTSNMYVPPADYIQEKGHSLFSKLPSSHMLKERIALQGIKCNSDLPKVVLTNTVSNCSTTHQLECPLTWIV